MIGKCCGCFFQSVPKVYQISIRHKKELRSLRKLLNLLVPRAGVEPARPYERGILSPLRLPISPPRHR